jgi:hypothetical protein
MKEPSNPTRFNEGWTIQKNRNQPQKEENRIQFDHIEIIDSDIPDTQEDVEICIEPKMKTKDI